MKPLSTALSAHLAGELTNLAYLVQITRVDGTIKGFTTFDQDITIGGVTYKAHGALTPSALESTNGLATDNLEVTGILNSEDIVASDIEAGLYDNARIDVYACNWSDLTQGTIQLRRGWLGEVLLSGGHYTAEVRGLHDLLQCVVGDFYTPECRYDLGDSNCTIALGPITVTGAVTGVTDNATFSDTSQTAADGTFDYGKLTWTSGANNGLAMEVKNWDGVNLIFTLWLPMPNVIQIGDTYSVYPGCDKRFTTCQTKFDNAINFGGFPYVPGVGNILQYPDTTS
jgi:uncharacterized phage protein (TIGR02218 family)